MGADRCLSLDWLVYSLLKGHAEDTPRCTLTARAGRTLEEEWLQLIYGFMFARPGLLKLFISWSVRLHKMGNRDSCPQFPAVLSIRNHCYLNVAEISSPFWILLLLGAGNC